MEDLNARPATRPRSRQASSLSVEADLDAIVNNSSPVKDYCAESIQDSAPSPEHSCSPVLTPSHEDDESICKQNKTSEPGIKLTLGSAQCAGEPNDRYAEALVLTCFGMVQLTSSSVSRVNPMPHPVSLESEDTGQLRRGEDGAACGQLAPRDIELLRLFKNEAIGSDLVWIPASKAATGHSGTIWATLYGQGKALGRDLGDTLQDIDVHLQDPIYAERDVVYWNPQRFQNTEGLRTISLKHDAQRSHPEVERAEVVDVPEHVTSEDDLPETRGGDA